MQHVGVHGTPFSWGLWLSQAWFVVFYLDFRIDNIYQSIGDASGRSTSLELLAQRSEEHTSELQSQFHLVCRLLLEKKKKQKTYNIPTIITKSLNEDLRHLSMYLGDPISPVMTTL